MEPVGAIGLEEYAAAIDRWLDYFTAEGIEQIAFGCIVLRR